MLRRRANLTPALSLSALDVLATATGVFVLLLVMLMPYYRQSFDAQAALDDTRVAEATARAEAAALSADLPRLQARLRARRGATVELAVRIAEAERQLPGATAQAEAAEAEVARQATIAPPVAPALDLMFVVDTTHSMRATLQSLAASLRGITRVLNELVPSLRVGIAAYNDFDTDAATPLVVMPLTAMDARGLRELLDFASSLPERVSRSRTIAEAVRLGLEGGLGQNWRRDALQIAILIGDAHPHVEDIAASFDLVRGFRLASAQRRVSALFINTANARRGGPQHRRYFEQVANVGRGQFANATGRMAEDVLLAVLDNN